MTELKPIDTSSGSETLGATGEKTRMTLFKDDRAEDLGAIVVSILVVAVAVLATM